VSNILVGNIVHYVPEGAVGVGCQDYCKRAVVYHVSNVVSAELGWLHAHCRRAVLLDLVVDNETFIDVREDDALMCSGTWHHPIDHSDR